MFEGKFIEGQQQTTILEEMEGVVSAQSFEAFLQWLYLRKIRFDLSEPEHQISATIELARFADMCNVTAIESEVARYLKNVLINHPNPERINIGITINTYRLTSQHIISATFLPEGHAIRRILAAATVRGYLLCENHRFAQETREYPSFGVDLLHEVGLTLKGMNIAGYGATWEDPLNGDKSEVQEFRSF
ncbi:uncharacterized protein N7498_005791 [Penicillium cinerascens]|uniref:BTB domain-containing protein n=1 Tax=Penicillium cinerascens TaxID=70096 RepID=A0A9W9MP45_9EURO|nr:uncharacterized protein N7498_005791 [Penicillium cinerascens]KAJ5204912.1 hypothetical protein N7498_005791 [Penicillium cinerascens]